MTLSPSEQGARNLKLAGQFLHSLLEDPSRLDAIPDGVEIVLIPDDDGELERTNLELAGRLTHDTCKKRGQQLHAEQTREDASGGVLLKPVCP